VLIARRRSMPFPTAEIDQMLREVEQGYASDEPR
jgi:hypothetical protein